MNKKIIFFGLYGIAAALLLPADILASTGVDKFDIKGLEEHTTKIQNLLFGNLTYILGGVGGAYGVYQAVVNGSPQPLFAYGGIGLAVCFIPKFADAFFKVSSMLLP